LDEIIAAADGIMIARGDLGHAIPMETLPFVKKDILKRCNAASKPAIVATEMLTSMIDDTDPSRADISDIAHAVLDGASATMLSNDTAVGGYPVETVRVMRTVVDEATKHRLTEVTTHF
ncbi:MAG: pyruvate kinase, partial [Candidatus Paceibacterota bacterium]